MAANDNTPPNLEDALEHECQMHTDGAAKFMAKVEKSDKSSLSYVNAWAEPHVLAVRDSLERLIAETKRLPGPNPDWVAPVENLNLKMVAYGSFMLALDGSDKDWTMTELYFEIGRLCGFLTSRRNLAMRNGQRVLPRLNGPADHVADQYEARAKFVTNMVERRGFDWDEWLDDEKGNSMVIGAAITTAIHRACPDVFEEFKSRPDSESQWDAKYLIQTAKTVAELEGAMEDAAALSPTLSPMNTKPNPWGPHWIGPYKLPSLAVMVRPVKRAFKTQRDYINEAMIDGRFDNALEALNALHRAIHHQRIRRGCCGLGAQAWAGA